jgi:type IV secretion system coupling TraD/TrwB family protein
MSPPDSTSGFWSGTAGLIHIYLFLTATVWVGCAMAKAPPRRYFAALLCGIVFMPVSGILVALFNLGLPHWLAVIMGVGVTLFLAFRVGFAGLNVRAAMTQLKRGSIVDTTSSTERPWLPWPGRSRRGGPATGVTLAALPIAPLDETKHFKLIGTTGTGKSTAIREILAGALGRGDRAVIADADGAYLKRFFDPGRGDVILNPFDAHSLKWDLAGEIREPYDFAELARSLIPDGDGEHRIWRQYGQIFLTAVLQRALAANVRDVGNLYRLVTSAPVEELQILLKDTPAEPFVAAGNLKMFGSIRAVTTSAVAALDYIQRQPAALFSIRQWVREGRGVLFLPYTANQIAALRTVISTWMRTAIFETLSLAEGDAHLWFVIDELDSLGPVDGLKDALPRLRKFGGRCVLGFQSIAQVSATYGRGEADTLVENCGNTLILRCSASEGGGTARFASKLIGEREIIRRNVSSTSHPQHWLATKTHSDQYVVESAVLASEIEQLPDLTGYLKLASDPTWRLVTLVTLGAEGPP